MAVDIIAESQTESVLSALDRGDADDKVRDQVSAALLRAMTRVSTELADIRTNLWKPDDLRHLIDERHERKCRDCPAKRMAEERLQLQRMQHQQHQQADPDAPAQDQAAQPQPVLQWVLHLAGNSGFQFFILLLFLISAFVYLTTGKGGVDAARETLGTMVSGGSK